MWYRVSSVLWANSLICGPYHWLSLATVADPFFLLMHLPQRSAIEQDVIVIDADTKEMLDAINFKDLSGVQVTQEK